VPIHVEESEQPALLADCLSALSLAYLDVVAAGPASGPKQFDEAKLYLALQPAPPPITYINA